MSITEKAWKSALDKGQYLLQHPGTSSVQDLLSVIKQINPTGKTYLSQDQIWAGYDLKSKLQDLLLQEYGEMFTLQPTDWDENTVLIVHKHPPYVDVCHTKLDKLSDEALEKVGTHLQKSAYEKRGKRRERNRTQNQPVSSESSPASLVTMAQEKIDEYDYEKAAMLLQSLQIVDRQDIPVLLRSLELLSDIGRLDICMELIRSLPNRFFSNSEIKEVSGNIYALTEKWTDALALYEECDLASLSDSSLRLYVRTLMEQKEYSTALDIIDYAAGKKILLLEMDQLRKEIYTRLAPLAEISHNKARAYHQEGNLAGAEASAKEVLELYPFKEEAKSLIKVIHQQRKEAEITELWKKIDETTDPMQNLRLLNQLKEIDSHHSVIISQRISTLESELQHAAELDLHTKIQLLIEKEQKRDVFELLVTNLKKGFSSDAFHDLISIYQELDCVIGNQALLSFSVKEAKEEWLAFLEARRLIQADSLDHANINAHLDKASNCFSHLPEFKQMEAAIKNAREEITWKEIQGDLNRLHNEIVVPQDIIILERSIRSKLQYLRSEKAKSIDEQMIRIQYEKALRLGHTRLSERQRSTIQDPSVREAIEKRVFASTRLNSFNITIKPGKLQTTTIERTYTLKAFPDDDSNIVLSVKFQEEMILFILDPNKMVATGFQLPPEFPEIKAIFNADSQRRIYGMHLERGEKVSYCKLIVGDRDSIRLTDEIHLDSHLFKQYGYKTLKRLYHLNNNDEILYLFMEDIPKEEDNYDTRILLALSLEQRKIIQYTRFEFFDCYCFVDQRRKGRILLADREEYLIYDEKLKGDRCFLESNSDENFNGNIIWFGPKTGNKYILLIDKEKQKDNDDESSPATLYFLGEDYRVCQLKKITISNNIYRILEYSGDYDSPIDLYDPVRNCFYAFLWRTWYGHKRLLIADLDNGNTLEEDSDGNPMIADYWAMNQANNRIVGFSYDPETKTLLYNDFTDDIDTILMRSRSHE